ncbi:MAG: energy transducer TonB [Verrucomicrobiota bacterium]
MISLNKIPRLTVLLAIAFAVFSPSAIAQDKKWDVQPSVKKSVAPTNPNNIAGLVTAKIEIDEKGNVVTAEISKATDQSLEAPVLDALKQWRFTPAKLAGKPIPCTIKVPFKFTS